MFLAYPFQIAMLKQILKSVDFFFRQTHFVRECLIRRMIDYSFIFQIFNQTLVEVLPLIIDLKGMYSGPKFILNEVVKDRKYG